MHNLFIYTPLPCVDDGLKSGGGLLTTGGMRTLCLSAGSAGHTASPRAVKSSRSFEISSRHPRISVRKSCLSWAHEEGGPSGTKTDGNMGGSKAKTLGGEMRGMKPRTPVSPALPANYVGNDRFHTMDIFQDDGREARGALAGAS